MSRLILLDTGMLGLISFPKGSDQARGCHKWLEMIASRRVAVRVPLICYYEHRREVVRLARDDRLGEERHRHWVETLQDLDRTCSRYGILKLDVKVIREATKIWSYARRHGIQTASDRSLDADVIIAATAQRAKRGGREVHVVTSNINHISRFAPACLWEEYPID